MRINVHRHPFTMGGRKLGDEVVEAGNGSYTKYFAAWCQGISSFVSTYHSHHLFWHVDSVYSVFGTSIIGYLFAVNAP